MEVCDYYLKRGTPVLCVTLDCSKAFDKCKFDRLFDKLMKKNVPAILVRALVYIYEEQKGCVKLAGHQSDTFDIKNGTRQGSVASPAFATQLRFPSGRKKSMCQGQEFT